MRNATGSCDAVLVNTYTYTYRCASGAPYVNVLLVIIKMRGHSSVPLSSSCSLCCPCVSVSFDSKSKSICSCLAFLDIFNSRHGYTNYIGGVPFVLCEAGILPHPSRWLVQHFTYTTFHVIYFTIFSGPSALRFVQ